MHNKSITSRRALALCLAAALLLASLVLPSFAAELTGAGTESDPYRIGSEAELIAFRDRVNSGETGACATLTADFALSKAWTAIGTKENPYRGTFDGGGHTISNFNSSYSDPIAALFGYNHGKIQKLTVFTEANYGVYGTDYTAAVCAINYGKITDCVSQGYLWGMADKAFTGGIAALNFGVIANCVNTAAVCAWADNSCAGGIAAVAAEGSITDCENLASVGTMDGGRDATELCTGGIVGLNYAATVERCANSGSVSTSNTRGYTGGVAGLNNGVVTDSLNSSANILGGSAAGGVAGYIYTNSDTGLTAQVRNTLDVGGKISVYGKNEGGAAANNYYKAASSASGAGQTAVTEHQLSSGEVTYRLNNGSTENSAWGQKINSDGVPVIGSSDTVYATFENGEVKEFSNEQGYEHEFDENGTCTVDGCGYSPVKLDSYTLTLDGAVGVSFYYEIEPAYVSDDVSVTFTMDGNQTVVPLDELYMGYRAYNSGELYTYVPAGKSGAYYYGNTPKRPASELGTTYEVAFFVKEDDGSYTQVSDTKLGSAYSYIYSMLSSTNSDGIKNLCKALYLYGEAAKAYFATVQ